MDLEPARPLTGWACRGSVICVIAGSSAHGRPASPPTIGSLFGHFIADHTAELIPEIAKVIPEITSLLIMYLEGLRFASRAH
jgi:hypothetical protein